MLTLVAAVLAYDRARDMVDTCRDMGPRLSSPPPLRSRYVRSDTRDEKDMLCYVFWFGVVQANCLVGEKDVSGMARANVTIIVLSRGPGSRGRDGNSIDGSYGEGMEEAYLQFEGEER
jgi:hypothetical protein